MIWSNTHKPFFFNLSIFLGRQGPSHCHRFSHWCGAEPEAGWLEAAQAGGSRPHVHCAGPFCKSPPLLISVSFLRNLSLSKQRHRNHTSEECYLCIFASIWTAGQNQTQVVGGLWSPPRLLVAPAQARARAHQESCRTEDVTSAGEDRLTPM